MNKLILDESTVDDLVRRLSVNLLEAINQHTPKPYPPEKYLTRKETAKLLQVSLVTLNDWSKKGFIQSYRIGGRIRYKLSEIDEALVEVKNQKYRRK